MAVQNPERQPKLFLGVFSCHKYKYTNSDLAKDWFTRPKADRLSGIRNSWLKDVTCDYKIIKGIGDEALRQPDELFLNCMDDYHHSTDKLRALIKYTFDRGYDYLLKVDDDVYVYWDRLMQNVPTADYVGGGPFGPGDTYCSGATYWLSRRSMSILLTSPAGCWAEDRWAGEALNRNGIKCAFDTRYHVVKPTRNNQYISDADLALPNNYLTLHSLSPDQMRRHHHGH